MNLEESRLRTFQTWPANAAVERQRIAKAGFYYTGQALEVECFSCGGKLSEWNYGDQVMARHRRLNPECPFVKNPIQSGNVPILNSSASNSLVGISSSETSSVLDHNGSQSSPNSLFEPNVTEGNNNIYERQSVSVTSRTPRGSFLHNNQNHGVTNHGPNGLVTVQTPSEHSHSIHMGTFNQTTMHRSEAARLESFRTWPIPLIVTPESLAKAGFYYTKQADKVQCAFCSGVVGHWEAGDDPDREHRRHFPSCPLLYNVPVGNIPLGTEASVSSPNGLRQYEDACSSVVLREVRPFSRPEREHQDSSKKLPDPSDMKELGIQSHRGPRYPKYSTFESRLRTFTNWPSNLQQTPQQLAQAGFYYVGLNDQVRCFHCDGGLRKWDASDDPWTEHARWFSKCAYVVLVKGEEFIQQALVNHPPHMPASALLRERDQTVQNQRPYKVRDVTEEELEGLMNTVPATNALQVGLDASKIKQALRQKMEQTGLPYSSSDNLIEAVLDLSETHSSNSPVAGPSHEPGAIRQGPVMRTLSIPEAEVEGQQEQNTNSDDLPSNMSQSMPSLTQRPFAEPDLQSRIEVNAQSLPHLPGCKITKTGALSLEEENRRLKEARLCKICMDEEVGVVFLPCGHLVTCVSCAPSLQDCPMCRQPIKATVRTFLS